MEQTKWGADAPSSYWCFLFFCAIISSSQHWVQKQTWTSGESLLHADKWTFLCPFTALTIWCGSQRDRRETPAPLLTFFTSFIWIVNIWTQVKTNDTSTGESWLNHDLNSEGESNRTFLHLPLSKINFSSFSLFLLPAVSLPSSGPEHAGVCYIFFVCVCMWDQSKCVRAPRGLCHGLCESLGVKHVDTSPLGLITSLISLLTGWEEAAEETTGCASRLFFSSSSLHLLPSGSPSAFSLLFHFSLPPSSTGRSGLFGLRKDSR